MCDIDLYGDLDVDVGDAAATVPANVDSVRSRSGGGFGDSVGGKDENEQADNKAVEVLWELLRKVENADADGEHPSAEVQSVLPDQGWYSVDVLCTEDVPERETKRPRADVRFGAKVEPAKVADDDLDFDFEADLPIEQEVSRRSDELPSLRRPSAGAPGAAPWGKEYVFNPSTGRWEPASMVQAVIAAPVSGFRSGNGSGKQGACGKGKAGAGRKGALCRNHVAGKCRWGAECYFAHNEDQLTPSFRAESMKRRFVDQCAAAARADARQGTCEYPQALAVRLAMRFEARPEDMLSSMVQAGLPTGADQRATVKALLRLCHPDKCKHPDAKKAVQILGPLMQKAV